MHSNIIPWTKDYLPNDHKYFTFLKKVFRHEFRKNWFRRISTPILECNDLLKKVYWDDFFWKNIFTINENISLRLEPSLWALRSYVNWELWEEIQPIYIYHIDRYFKKWDKIIENYYIWWDIIGENDPILDCLLVYITYSTLNKIGLSSDFKIRINSLPNSKEMVKYIDELKSFYENKKHLLSDESLEFLKTNPIKLLTAKGEDELILSSQAPQMSKFLKKDTKIFFDKFLEYLEMLKIPYEIDNKLISDFTYFTNTIWSFNNLLTWEEISKWWRYNNLSKIINQDFSDVPSVWFTINVDRLIEMLKIKNVEIKNKDELDLYFVQLWDEAKKVVFELSLEAREKGIKTMVSLWTPSMKEQILKAQRTWAKYVVMVWVMEARNGNFQVRDMEKWTQTEVKKDDLIDYIIWKIWENNLDFYCPAKDFIVW